MVLFTNVFHCLHFVYFEAWGRRSDAINLDDTLFRITRSVGTIPKVID